MLRLLLVEDSLDIRPRMVRCLSDVDGVSLLATTETIQETEYLIRDLKPDLLVLDLHLADGNATTAIRNFAAMAPGMDIVVHTNDANAVTRHQCLQEGAGWFFDKSGELEALIAFIHERAQQATGSPRYAN